MKGVSTCQTSRLLLCACRQDALTRGEPHADKRALEDDGIDVLLCVSKREYTWELRANRSDK
jgi:hypothetical protein